MSCVSRCPLLPDMSIIHSAKSGTPASHLFFAIRSDRPARITPRFSPNGTPVCYFVGGCGGWRLSRLENEPVCVVQFRLWVARNPIVTQFLQSVFPYDEHREWGDDRKHLPFIHNREVREGREGRGQDKFSSQGT